MRIALKAAMIALTLAAAPMVAQAGTMEGIAIGAGTGAIVAGPPGAVVGGVVGAVVGGPNIVRQRHYTRDRYYARGQRACWRDRNGYRHCSWR